jgi:hypothetical protein
MSRKQPAALAQRMQRVVRKVEAAGREATGGDPGTGQTIIRLARHQPPLRTLEEAHKIGADELRAAAQIALAVTVVCSRGTLAAASLERVAYGRNDKPWPIEIALAVRNYQTWQNHWSAEWKLTRNPMLEVIWSAVIDEWPISVIAQNIGYGHQRTQRAIMHGLRHYAAWAGMVTGNQARAWLDGAQHVFARTPSGTTS